MMTEFVFIFRSSDECFGIICIFLGFLTHFIDRNSRREIGNRGQREEQCGDRMPVCSLTSDLNEIELIAKMFLWESKVYSKS